MFQIAVLVSGGGSNLQAIIDAITEGSLACRIGCVISDREGAYGIERARKHDLPVYVFPKEQGDLSARILDVVEDRADLIVLAGFLSVLTGRILEQFNGRIINVHPSLIPAFCGKGMYGLRVHEAALSHGVKVTGCTVHFVDEGTDTGKIILQRAVTVDPDETPQSLQQKVLAEEHRLLPEAIRLLSGQPIIQPDGSFRQTRQTKQTKGEVIRMKRALISVYHKEGILELAQFLTRRSVEILSTGGSAAYLKEHGVPVTEVSDVTGFPEILGGRVKTLHPAIHGGILAVRGNEAHFRALRENGIEPIDLVAVNLYPFIEKAGAGLSLDETVEFIDIGGPAMIRAAAKNFQDVVVLTDQSDYQTVMDQIAQAGDVSLTTRRRLAGKVFNLMSAYDAAVSRYLLEDEFPDYLALSYQKDMALRYGENAHQRAACYRALDGRGVFSHLEILNGKQLSFNNLKDMDSAWKTVWEFKEPACCGLKHNSPCGVAIGSDALDAYQKAHACDPVSLFGGIVAFNRTVDRATAEEVVKTFLEVLIAPDFEPEALSVLQSKKNLRVIQCTVPPEDAYTLTKVDGAILVQQEDRLLAEQLETVTQQSASPEQLQDLLFAMKVCKHVPSNAIVTAKGGVTTGIGGGQVSRIRAAEQALAQGEGAEVLASDAFFPFADVVDLAARRGIRAIIQPGGSLKDEDSIRACDERGIAMIFTGTRHFKH